VFFRWLPYLVLLGTIAAAAIDLYQKREEYKNRRLRQAVITLFIGTAMLTLFGLYHDNVEKEADKKKAETAIHTLQGEVQAANQSQKDNTSLYLQQFKTISNEVGDLKIQIRTDTLQKKLDSVQAELLSTQKAMAPGPKATLAFTFFPFKNPPLSDSPRSPLMVPVTDIKLPLSADGSVHVQFSIVNLTEVDALSASINLVICDGCKFAKKVEGFQKLSGDPDTHRFIALPQVHAHEYLRAIEADVIPPPKALQFTMGIMYRCNTCILPQKPSLGTVLVMRDFVKPFVTSVK